MNIFDQLTSIINFVPYSTFIKCRFLGYWVPMGTFFAYAFFLKSAINIVFV